MVSAQYDIRGESEARSGSLFLEWSNRGEVEHGRSMVSCGFLNDPNNY